MPDKTTPRALTIALLLLLVQTIGVLWYGRTQAQTAAAQEKASREALKAWIEQPRGGVLPPHVAAALGASVTGIEGWVTAAPVAVDAGGIIRANANPSDSALNVHVAGGTVVVDGGTMTTAMQSPIAPVGFPGADGGGFAVLPDGGAFEPCPTTSADAGVLIPSITLTQGYDATWNYTAADAGGQMAVKVYAFDGTSWGQLASPVDQSFSAILLGPGTGRYSVTGSIPRGATRLAFCGADVNDAGAPSGNYTAEIAFQ